MASIRNDTISNEGQRALVDSLIDDGLHHRFAFDPKRGWFELGEDRLWRCTGKEAPELLTYISRRGQGMKVKGISQMEACLRLAQADSAFRRENAFDRENLVVGLPNGKVVDFSNNVLQPVLQPMVREPFPGELISRHVGASPNRPLFDQITYSEGDEAPPKWGAFLRQVLPSEAEVIYMQCLFGMCLLGDTREHKAHLFYGKTRNGKSVTLNILEAVAGGYHSLVETKALLSNKNEHPTWLAKLANARLAADDDIENAAWATSIFKKLATGAKLQARFMYGDFFEFWPKCSLVFTGNYLPRLPKNAEALRERIRIIPFPRIVPKENRNMNLEGELLKELPGIVAWALEGAATYLRCGLPDNTPAMEALRKEWQSEETDPVEQWLRENVQAVPGAKLSNAELFKAMGEVMVVGQDHRPVTKKLKKLFPMAQPKPLGGNKGRGYENVALRQGNANSALLPE